MIKENEWDNENHEVLYALFILEANRAINIINRPSSWSEEQAIHVAMFNYMSQWEDRAVCENNLKEYDGTLSRFGREIVLDEFDQWELPKDAWDDLLSFKNKKIKFRFVENEND